MTSTAAATTASTTTTGTWPPLIFSTVLGRASQVAEYQVHQRERGADVLVQQADQPPDLVALRRDLETGLTTLGLPHPAVTLRIVATIPRQTTGKTRRFIPLTTSATIYG